MRSAIGYITMAIVGASGCGGVSSSPDGGAPVTIGDVSLQSVPPWSATLRDRCRRFEPLVEAAAKRHDVDAGLLAGIIRVESSFRSNARSRVGALGLMQVMPKTGSGMKCDDLLNPADNIECGIRVLKGFLKRFDGNLIYALSGYNAGNRMPRRAWRNSSLPKNFKYVEKVLRARAAYLRHGC